MTKTKSTKRALLMSGLALLMCVSMLIGSTFAWFTDSVSSTNNIIKSGNLDVELEYYDGDSWEKVTATTNVFEENTLWEPGHTEVVYLKVSNLGTLALKYQLGINIVNEIESVNVAGEALRLSDYIEFGAIDGVSTPYADRAAARAAVTDSVVLSTGYTKAGNIEAGADAQYVALVVYMPETVGNEANYRIGEVAPEITLGINLMATQYTSEFDSFDDQYDKFADYDGEISNAVSFAAALKNGGTYKVTDNIVVDEYVTIPAGVTVALDLNGKTLSNTEDSYIVRNYGTLTLAGKGTIDGNIGNYAVRTETGSNLTIEEGIVVDGGFGAVTCFGGTLTINGGDFSNEETNSSHYVVYATNNSTVVINGGTFTFGEDQYAGANGSPILRALNGSTIEINGGTFDAGDGSALCYGSETIVIKGGTFKNEAATTYGGTFNGLIADGYAAIKNDDGSYTVYGSGDTMTVEDGAVLDLGGVAFPGKIVAEGDLTIKGDTSIKTLSSTSGGTITVEEGKTLTLNNFSFGSNGNADAEYVITGGTVTANYGFFQHGKYDIYSNLETDYMYYSYGSDITVYGTVHSKGLGDGLDYVRGKVTIANGGKSIHDAALWVGQPTSLGAMSATLIVEEGGSVQAKSLSVHPGSTLQIDAENLTAGEVTSIVCNTLSVTGTVEAINNDTLTATVNGNKIVLE